MKSTDLYVVSETHNTETSNNSTIVSIEVLDNGYIVCYNYRKVVVEGLSSAEALVRAIKEIQE